MTYEIKIVPDLCCMETSERVLTTGVESFQNTAMKTGSFLLRWHNFPLKRRHRGQEDPAAARIHGKPFRKKEKKEKKQPNNMRYKHCAKVRDTVLLWQVSCNPAGRRRWGRGPCLKRRKTRTSTRSHARLQRDDRLQIQHTHTFTSDRNQCCPSICLLGLTRQPLSRFIRWQNQRMEQVYIIF